MSLPALLSLHGVHVPRHVTVNGQIVFGEVTSTDRGLVHPTHGPVTQVPPHTFHADSDPVDTGIGQPPWWIEQEKINRHVNAMKDAFPSFTYLAPSSDEVPCWFGDIDTGRGVFTIAIALRHDEGLPSVRVLSRQRLGRDIGRIYRPSPHLYTSGNLCIADETDWKPEEHTAAVAVVWAAHWLACFTEWRMTLKWPVPGVNIAA